MTNVSRSIGDAQAEMEEKVIKVQVPKKVSETKTRMVPEKYVETITETKTRMVPEQYEVTREVHKTRMVPEDYEVTKTVLEIESRTIQVPKAQKATTRSVGGGVAYGSVQATMMMDGSNSMRGQVMPGGQVYGSTISAPISTGAVPVSTRSIGAVGGGADLYSSSMGSGGMLGGQVMGSYNTVGGMQSYGSATGVGIPILGTQTMGSYNTVGGMQSYGSATGVGIPILSTQTMV